MSATCVFEIAQGEQCGIVAYERCFECQRAFCRSHQAWERTPDGTRQTSPIENWCTECQARQEEEGKSRVAAHHEREQAAKLRIDALIKQLNYAGFPGATERVVKKTVKGSFGRTREMQTQYEPAIPIGPVSWEHLYCIPREGWQHDSSRLETGITRNGDYVVMDPRPTEVGKNWTARGHNFIGICAMLEAHVRKHLPGSPR